MNFLSHTLVLLLALMPGLSAGVSCGPAPVGETACDLHLDATVSPGADEICGQLCREQMSEACCDAAPRHTEPAVPAVAQLQPSHEVAALPSAFFWASDAHLLQLTAADSSVTPRGPTLQTQHVRLQV